MKNFNGIPAAEERNVNSCLNKLKLKIRTVFYLLTQTLLILNAVIPSSFSQEPEQEDTKVVTFEIKEFYIEGNSLWNEEDMKELLSPYVGESKTAADVEDARDSIEGFYHKSGYPAVFVNIPEQDVEDGTIRLEVIESRIRKVNVTGNRYFTQESILKRLPSLREGGLIYLPIIQQEFALINRNTDFNVSPTLVPAKELGAIDIELKVTDKLPLHGSLELNNRSSHNTTDYRINGSIQYDNLWQREHTIALQYQTSPRDMDEVQLLVGSYVFTAPWNDYHTQVFYAVWSDSDNAFSEGFQVIGEGNIFGYRYIIPLPSLERYSHNVTLGLDYKDFNEDVNFQDTEQKGLKTPIKYMSLSASYTGVIMDDQGKTQFNLGLNMAFRNLIADQREFEIKRYKARGDYLYLVAGIERINKLPLGMSLSANVDGQIASEPLISNEQFVAGGMENVRGYKESEITGDNAFHGTINVYFPDINRLWGKKGNVNGIAYLFYDMAKVWRKNPLEGEDKSNMIHGAGAGIKGTLLKGLEYKVDWAKAMEETDNVKKGDDSFYFRVKYGF
ncbi:MAG: ShlB/FhaC/HecB family hemolysin secretion/activation protein [Deltaproteobacteria bacterium]|nr:ShlB/FhaC/HecB family hemolysin secretion/activation protein [Deltaproteobacteria bacterium]